MKIRIVGIAVAVVLALAGMVALLGYVGGADSRAMAQIRTVSVYVVKQEIPAGTPAVKLGSYITTAQIPAVGAIADRVENLSDVAGEVTTTRLVVGEQLLKARFAKVTATATGDEGLAIPKGFEAITINLPPERELGDKIQTGDRVGVIATVDHLGRQVVQKALVLDVTNPKAGAAVGQNSVLITLALQHADAETVAWAQDYGHIYLALQPPAALEGSHTVNTKVVFP